MGECKRGENGRGGEWEGGGEKDFRNCYVTACCLPDEIWMWHLMAFSLSTAIVVVASWDIFFLKLFSFWFFKLNVKYFKIYQKYFRYFQIIFRIKRKKKARRDYWKLCVKFAEKWSHGFVPSHSNSCYRRQSGNLFFKLSW